VSLRRCCRLASAVLLAGCSSCTPLNPSMRDVAGRWQVRCEGGTETLDLRPDGRYTYTIEAPRRRTKVEGRWSIEPPRERLAGARVILRQSPQSCESTGTSTGFSKPANNSLAPVWEWGHTELSFHPDLGGFRRIGSSQ
jgi:hypothetical protein